MVIAVKLRTVCVEGQNYLVPSHMKWEEVAKRWVVVVQTQNQAYGKRQYTGFPAQRHGSVWAAYVQAIRFLEKLHKESESTLHTTTHAHHRQEKTDPTLDVGIDLSIVVDRHGNEIHYFRVHAGSHSAGTLMRRSLRLGRPKFYSKEFYDMVYAKAKETRVYLLGKHQELLQKQRRESNQEVYKTLRDFIAGRISASA